MRPLLLLLSLSLFARQSGSTNQPSGPPNVLLIVADDLGYADLGAYGQKLIETPNIDALARGGMRFTQFYSGSPVCAPSRCVLLTGRHTGHAYVRDNDEWRERGPVWDFAAMDADPNLEGQRPFPKDSVNLAEVMQARGYYTGIIGKWGLGGPTTEGIPNEQGFDFFYGYNCQRQAHTYYPTHLWRNREKVSLNNPLLPPHTSPLPADADTLDPASYAHYTQQEYSPDLMQREALQFISEKREKPFFLMYTTVLPHVALQAPQRWVDHYHEKFGDEKPYTGKGYFPNRYPRATYAAMISYLDEKVGELVAELKKQGLYDNTIILFTSDNGPAYNAGTDSEYFDSAHPFRNEYGRTKGFVYEGGIRVPMIAHWPGRIAAGTTTDHISAFWDFLPTLSDITGANAPANDGISFWPLLSGKGTQPVHPYLYWEFKSYGGQQAVRMGKWKGIREGILKNNLTLHLYDLEADPAEQQDVAAEHPDVAAQIEAIMQQAHTRPDNPAFNIAALGDL